MPIAQTRLETMQICKLLQCVREEDREQIEKLTLNGVPHLINYNEPNEGDTALNIAACANNDTMIELLLDIGAHPDVMDFKGRSAVMRAAEFGHVQCMEKLARAGADMKLTDLEGKGIIFYCISPTQRHAKCLEIALQHGAEVNNRNKHGKPVFYVACETAIDNEDVCIQLLSKGADPNGIHEVTGRTPLMITAASGSVKVAQAILERGGEVNALDKKQAHAAHYAAKGGFLDILRCLSAYGADFDQVDDKGNTPIHFASDGHALCVRFLGQRGGNPKPKNDDGFTARVIAKDNGHKDCMKEIRKAERNHGKIGKNNEPWAIQLYDWSYERSKVLKEMYEKFDPDLSGAVPKDDFEDGLRNMGAPLNDDALKKVLMAHDKNKDGMIDYNDFLTGKKYVNKLYLMSAYEGKKKKKKGGKGRKKKGKTKLPMPICVQDEGSRTAGGGPPEVFIERHLHFTDTGRFDRDNPPEHPLKDDSAWYLHHPDKAYINVNEAAKSGDLDSLKNAINRGFAIDTRDKYYKTPLMAACSVGNVNAVKFLLENGATVNTCDNFKWTPMHHACHAGQLDIVELLLERGADMDPVALNGGTPLMRAIESSRMDLVQFLIAKGAKVQIENRKGHNPVDVAMAYADPRVLEIVQNKWDSLPAPNDKKKGKGGKKRGGSPKRPQTTTGSESKHDNLPPVPAYRASSPSDDMSAHPRKGSILRAASALAGGIEEREDITYVPLRAWTQQPTTEDLIRMKQIRRDRFTYEVDFADFKMPFNKNICTKAEGFAALEDD